MSLAISAGLVLGTLVLAVPGMSAQTEQARSDDTPREASADCLLSRTPVQNAPFSADATIVWQPPASSGRSELRASSRYYRDREGRVRVEQGFAGSGHSPNRIIVAAADGRAYDMDPIARTTDITLHGVAENPLDQESLGELSLAGLHATGTRFTTQLPADVFGYFLLSPAKGVLKQSVVSWS
jgi:hypothetical protein